MNTKQMPTLVIVGRANVGKSTLFNRLSQDAQSVTYDQPGVTRDIVTDVITIKDRAVQLIDTGGVSLRKLHDPIDEEVRHRALQAIDTADCVIFVCDGQVGILPEDREIAGVLHKRAKHVLLAVNKTDLKIAQEQMYEFDALGFPIYPITATHGRGIDELLEAALAVLPVKMSEEQTNECRVAIIGKPNVGKSSLMNALAQKERAIVADMPGTTREAISESISFYQEDIKITDTPGIRRKRGVTEPLEQLMVKSAMRAIDAAHIVLLMVDASAGELSDQELKLAFYAFQEKHKALIILFNKQDITGEYERESLERMQNEYKYLIDKVATLSISCKTGKNVGKVLPLIHAVWHRSRQHIPDEDITVFLRQQLEQRPLYHNGQVLTFARARQTRITPITIQLVVGNPKAWEQTQLGFIENQLRREYDLEGVALVFDVRKRK